MSRKRKKSRSKAAAGAASPAQSGTKSAARPAAKPAAKAAPDALSRIQSVPRRTWILAAVGVVAAVGGASALHAWDVRSRTLHDLGIIGQGTPVMVQVHDTSCGICRRLKSSATAALDGRDDIHYRVADIGKPEGRELQTQYNIPKTSLLFFDAAGTHVYSHTGLLDADEVGAMVDDVLAQIERRDS